MRELLNDEMMFLRVYSVTRYLIENIELAALICVRPIVKFRLTIFCKQLDQSGSTNSKYISRLSTADL